MANRVVTLMEKCHRINFVGKARRDNADIFVERCAVHMDQRCHSA